MHNIKCLVEECKYNSANFCTAKQITVATSSVDKSAVSSDDTACEMFEPRS